jgi:hypothetical protein
VRVDLGNCKDRGVAQLVWSAFEMPLFEGRGEIGETGETRETGEEFDLFRRRMPAFNGTELKFSNNPRSNPDRRR